MASNLRGYSADEVLNKVLNTSNDSIQVDVVSGSEYAEDSVHSSTDVGTFVLGVRQDSIAALGADGDYVPFQVNASGALYVEISSGGSADAAHVDDAGFTLGTHSGMMMMGFAGTQSVDANDAGAIAMETDGSVHIHDGGNTITVDGTVTANLSAIDNAVLDAMVVDLAALETLQTSTNTKLDTLETTLTAIETDQAAIETLLTAANVDHAANEVLLGTIDADTGAIKTAVEIIDNAIDGSEMQVDIVADGAGLATAANQLADGHNVTIDNSSGGSAVNIQDGGNTITVDGTVTANLSATDNAVLDTIDAVLDTIKTDTGTIDSDTDAIKTATESSNTHLGNMFYDTALSVTPSDGSDLTGEPFYAVYVGTGGDLKVDMSDGGSAVTLSNVASGQLLPIMVERIYSTGTTASNIIAFK